MYANEGEDTNESRQIELLKDCQLITEQQVKELCLKAREILVEEANVQWIDSPVTVSSSIIYYQQKK